MVLQILQKKLPGDVLQSLLPGRSEFISRDRQGEDTVNVNRRTRSEGAKPEWSDQGMNPGEFSTLQCLVLDILVPF